MKCGEQEMWKIYWLEKFKRRPRQWWSDNIKMYLW